MVKIGRYKTLVRDTSKILLALVSIAILGTILTACDTGNTQPQASGYQTNVKTSDGLFLVQFHVTPNRLGANTFVVVPTASDGKKPATTMKVHLDTTMLDMDMGTDIIDLQVNKNGSYNGQGYLTMAGNWQIRIELVTTDGKIHETSVKFTAQS
jgi:copper transport protein